MKAVIIKEHGVAAVAEVKDKTLRPDYILIKTVAVAVNPTDFHHTASVGPIGGILGCDLSGTVEQVGPACKTTLRKGDAVYAVCHGADMGNLDSGAYGEYALVKDGYAAKMPSGMTFEQAATLGVGVTTVGQTLYMALGLPVPPARVQGKEYILVYGGSTASGSLAIQWAKLSGLTVVTTASPKNFSLVQSRGADAVFDYHDPNCAADIKAFTQNSLRYVLDTISTKDSYKIIADALPEQSTDREIKLVSLLPLEGWDKREDVKAASTLCYTALGEPFNKFGVDFPAVPEHYEHGVTFWKVAAEMLALGRFEPHPCEVRPGGFQGLVQGIQEIAGGNVSGRKLVYRVAETTGIETQEAGPERITAPEFKDWDM